MKPAKEFAHENKLIVAMYPVLPCMHRDCNTDCRAAVVALEARDAAVRRETLRYLAAYLLDRGDQQDTDGGKWVPLADAAHAIAEGEFEEAWKHGEIDEGDVLERVDKWFARADQVVSREREP